MLSWINHPNKFIQLFIILHRIGADRRGNFKSGTRTDAVKYAVGANSTHGLPRRNVDKRRAVQIAVKEFPGLTQTQYAEMCGVTQQFISKLKKESTIVVDAEYVTRKNGSKYPINPAPRSPKEPKPETLLSELQMPTAGTDEQDELCPKCGRVAFHKLSSIILLSKLILLRRLSYENHSRKTR